MPCYLNEPLYSAYVLLTAYILRLTKSLKLSFICSDMKTCSSSNHRGGNTETRKQK